MIQGAMTHLMRHLITLHLPSETLEAFGVPRGVACGRDRGDDSFVSNAVLPTYLSITLSSRADRLPPVLYCAGMTMIDDDLGMMGPDAFPDISVGAGGGSQRSLPSASEYAARVAAQHAAREAAAFPALGGGTSSGGGGPRSRGGAQADDEHGLRCTSIHDVEHTTRGFHIIMCG